MANHFMLQFELVVPSCSMRFLSLDNSATEIFVLLEHVPTSLSMTVARSSETAYWSLWSFEPWRWDKYDLSNVGQTTPKNWPHIWE